MPRRDEAMATARQMAEQIGDTFHDVLGICLGGSLAEQDHQQDDVSDIDLFAFWSGSRLPAMADFDRAWRERGRSPSALLRRRSYFIEQRHRGIEIDVDVKYMTMARVETFAAQDPNLDELYLEKFHALQRYQVLYDPTGAVAALLEAVRGRFANDVEKLADYALETYGKLVYSTVKQGFRRSEREAAAYCAAGAAQALVKIAYLQAGECPPPYKWIASESRLATIRTGLDVRSGLQRLTRSLGGTVEDWLAALYEMEVSVARDYAAPPWSRFGLDRWWWHDYAPLAGEPPSLGTAVYLPGAFEEAESAL